MGLAAMEDSTNPEGPVVQKYGRSELAMGGTRIAFDVEIFTNNDRYTYGLPVSMPLS